MTISKDITPVNLTELENQVSRLIESADKDHPVVANLTYIIEQQVDSLSSYLKNCHSRSCLFADLERSYLTCDALAMVSSQLDKPVYEASTLSSIRDTLKHLSDLHNPSNLFMVMV